MARKYDLRLVQLLEEARAYIDQVGDLPEDEPIAGPDLVDRLDSWLAEMKSATVERSALREAAEAADSILAMRERCRDHPPCADHIAITAARAHLRAALAAAEHPQEDPKSAEPPRGYEVILGSGGWWSVRLPNGTVHLRIFPSRERAVGGAEMHECEYNASCWGPASQLVARAEKAETALALLREDAKSAERPQDAPTYSWEQRAKDAEESMDEASAKLIPLLAGHRDGFGVDNLGPFYVVRKPTDHPDYKGRHDAALDHVVDAIVERYGPQGAPRSDAHVQVQICDATRFPNARDRGKWWWSIGNNVDGYAATEADAYRAVANALDADAQRSEPAAAGMGFERYPGCSRADLAVALARISGALLDAGASVSANPVNYADDLNRLLGELAPGERDKVEQLRHQRDGARRAWARMYASVSSDFHYGYEAAVRQWGEDEARRLFPFGNEGDDGAGYFAFDDREQPVDRRAPHRARPAAAERAEANPSFRKWLENRASWAFTNDIEYGAAGLACEALARLDGDTSRAEVYAARLQENAAIDVVELTERRAEVDRLRALLARCVKYAREDRMQTPGVTRLARALREAELLLSEDPQR